MWPDARFMSRTAALPVPTGAGKLVQYIVYSRIADVSNSDSVLVWGRLLIN